MADDQLDDQDTQDLQDRQDEMTTPSTYAPKSGANGGPTLVDQLKVMQQRMHAPGIMGGIQDVFSVINGIGNPEAQQEYQNKILAQKMASLPEAEALQGPYREAAAQQLMQGKIDEFSHTLTEARRQGNIAKRAALEENLTQAFPGIYAHASQNMTADQMNVVAAKAAAGMHKEALNDIGRFTTANRNEGRKETGLQIQDVNQQISDMKGAGVPEVQVANKLIGKLQAQGITEQDLQHITEPDVYKKYNIKSADAMQTANALAKFEQQTGSKVGGPGWFSKALDFMGIQKAPSAATSQQFLGKGVESIVTPEALQQQQQVDQQTQNLKQSRQRLKDQLAGKRVGSQAPQQQAAPSAISEGATGTLKDGTKVVRKGGKWISR